MESKSKIHVAQIKPPKIIPIILDTDIGTDIDDTWALALMLKCPELDIKLITTATGDTTYRAKIVAKMLEITHRTDIPIGVGIAAGTTKGAPQEPWVRDYDLKQYPGKIYADGVQALIDTVRQSNEKITIIAIGPLTNLGAALEKDKELGHLAKFVGMQGSVRKGYNGSPTPDSEFNVVKDIAAAKAVFQAPWPIIITPLDTCGIVVLKREKFMAVSECTEPLTQALIENYRIWAHKGKWYNKLTQSSVLFDTVAIYLAFSEELLVMEDLPLLVDDSGCTVINPNGKICHCAMAWKDLSRFEDFLVFRLTR